MHMSATDSQAQFEQVVVPHLDAAYNLARWLAGNDHDAEDIAQEASLRAFRFLSGFRGGNSRSWLLTIVRNTAYTWLKQNRPQTLVSVSDEEWLDMEDSTTLTSQSSALHHADRDVLRSLEVERHLKTCAGCMAIKRSLHSLHSNLRHSDLSYQAPEALRQRIRQSVGSAPAETAPRNSRPWMWQFLTLGAIGFAIVALMLQPVGISEGDRLADEAISNHVRSLMAGHLMDVASTDQHTVKPWFNGKIDFAPEVKDFAAEGFPLIGGRLDYLNSQTVAALVYHRNQHTINVFAWPAKSATADTTQDRRGYTVINRNINGLHYTIVSDLNTKELSEFAKLFGE